MSADNKQTSILSHIVYILLTSAVIIFVMFRPFMPGRFDNLAIPLSFMVQIFSFIGLIFVPLGLFWWIKTKDPAVQESTRRRFLNTTLVIAGLISLIVSVGAFSQNHTSLAILFLVVTFLSLIRAFLKPKKDCLKSDFLPFYLIIIPIVVALARFLFIDKAVEFSRSLAISNSEALIQSIENYRISNGHYPVSIQALHYDISPEVVGISQYFYEPNGNAYNLYFKQFSNELDVEEIVMYNKLDEHYFTAHSQDILDYKGNTLVLRRGDRRRTKLSKPNWISIKFD